jgi:hypothetical protein
MKVIIVYTHNGVTLKFHNVSDLRIESDNWLKFKYIGINSGKQSQAVFQNVAGYICPIEN